MNMTTSLFKEVSLEEAESIMIEKVGKVSHKTWRPYLDMVEAHERGQKLFLGYYTKWGLSTGIIHPILFTEVHNRQSVGIHFFNPFIGRHGEQIERRFVFPTRDDAVSNINERIDNSIQSHKRAIEKLIKMKGSLK